MSAVLFALTDPIGLTWASKNRRPLLQLQSSLLFAAALLMGVALTAAPENKAITNALPWAKLTMSGYEMPQRGFLSWGENVTGENYDSLLFWSLQHFSRLSPEEQYNAHVTNAESM